jgi:hypothetical protein
MAADGDLGGFGVSGLGSTKKIKNVRVTGLDLQTQRGGYEGMRARLQDVGNKNVRRVFRFVAGREDNAYDLRQVGP